MIEFCLGRTKVCLSPLFFAVTTLFLVYDRSGIASAVLFFSLLHEFAHFAAMAVLKIFPRKIALSLCGIRAEIPEAEKGKKLAVLSVGFLLNFILAACFFASGKIVQAYINAAIGVFTAFPLPCSDGGEIVRELFGEKLPENLFKIFGGAAIFALLLLGVKTDNYFCLIPIIYIFAALCK